MNIYGLNIPNESGFWDEVKLRAMNNYGTHEHMSRNVVTAIEEILRDIKEVLITSKEAYTLVKEIETDLEYLK